MNVFWKRIKQCIKKTMTLTFLLNSVSKMFVAVSRFNSVKNIGRTKKAKRCSVKIPQPKRFKTRNNCYGSKPRYVTIMFVKIDWTLLLPEWMLESLKVVLTFESVDKILWCDHLNETSLPVLSNSAICFQNFTKRNLETFVEFCPWPHLAVKGLKKVQERLQEKKGQSDCPSR